MITKINDFINKYGENLPSEAISALQEINEEHKYLKTIFDFSEWTISLVDHNGKYLKVNPKMEEIMGNMVGSKIGDKSNDKTIDSIISKMNKDNLFLSTKIIESIVNEKKQTFLIQVNRVDNKFLIMGSDITEVQELKSQQEFNERMTMLGEMSAFIVHEINNPLSNISLSSEIIEMTSTDPKIIEKSIKITQMTEVISKIIRSLKSFARKSTELSEFNLIDIIDQAQVIVGPKIKQSGVKVSVDIPDGVSLVGTDIDFLQVLVNLLSNSVDAIKDHDGDKWINIIWKDKSLHVIDSGKVIAPANVTKLFQKFHTTKGSKGNGIGLYLSKTILNKNGFDLNYKTTDRGNTSFVWSKVA